MGLSRRDGATGHWRTGHSQSLSGGPGSPHFGGMTRQQWACLTLRWQAPREGLWFSGPCSCWSGGPPQHRGCWRVMQLGPERQTHFAGVTCLQRAQLTPRWQALREGP
ncbi:hypothetical protein NDU88_010873 [Pleurodeles waltl]|uniref:Uncharacterized protein n=1 Tax=Pleurodeles waltl TaxID=8319 RepID=A0AAV7R1T0_PLEWA|nr:hypothetical protein NDU88_010873 [Pleurodeles waltl]